jgi:hypothetical protein
MVEVTRARDYDNEMKSALMKTLRFMMSVSPPMYICRGRHAKLTNGAAMPAAAGDVMALFNNE